MFKNIILNLLPALIFLTAYKCFGIYAATFAAMCVSATQITYDYCTKQKLNILRCFSAVLILLLGGFTILFHNSIFIKIKPTLAYLVFISIFLFYRIIKKESFTKLLYSSLNMDVNLSLWKKLDLCWIYIFILLSIINMYVAHSYSTSAWVYFKITLTPILFLLFLLQYSILSRYSVCKEFNPVQVIDE